MESESKSGSMGGVEVNVGLKYHSVIDYDRKQMRRALNKGAAMVRKEARRLISRRAISSPGDFPGMQTGVMRKAIGIIKRGSRGGWIKVGVKKTPEMKQFYPAFLYYGSPKTGLAPRKNFMTYALDSRREDIRTDMRDALIKALVPR